MMDLSDGLAADLPRLAAASHCGSTVSPELLPLNPGCTATQAMSDGEDFELLFALPPRSATALETAWKQRFPRLPLTRIGSLLSPSSPPSPSSHGYDHFAQR
ncbi:MAG: hypothetical protein WDN28_03755 [Chthoniobacter sp.]